MVAQSTHYLLVKKTREMKEKHCWADIVQFSGQQLQAESTQVMSDVEDKYPYFQRFSEAKYGFSSNSAALLSKQHTAHDNHEEIGFQSVAGLRVLQASQKA